MNRGISGAGNSAYNGGPASTTITGDTLSGESWWDLV